ncbi:hypothetical protein K438DRAFT_3269 [Mycena galopus ATCC 62051]|nr:hypothetical protein K438DRAFT_3269 [Mycena galopus ATCC 62051]
MCLPSRRRARPNTHSVRQMNSGVRSARSCRRRWRRRSELTLGSTSGCGTWCWDLGCSMSTFVQGLVHMGKGTIGLNPFFSDQSIMSRSAVAGPLATLTAFTDAKNFVLDKYHWMLYFLVTAMFPSFMITVDEELNSIPVTVRVGQVLDVVGQAGKLRAISGFQTHQTPVRLATTERAEFAMEEFSFGHVLGGSCFCEKKLGGRKTRWSCSTLSE